MPVYTLDVPTEEASGDAVGVLHLDPWKSLQVAGTFTATLQLEGSNDNVNWEQIGTDYTAPELRQITAVAQYMRITVDSYTSGTPLAYLAGHGPQGA